MGARRTSVACSVRLRRPSLLHVGAGRTSSSSPICRESWSRVPRSACPARWTRARWPLTTVAARRGVEGVDLRHVLPDGAELDSLAGAGGGEGVEVAERRDVRGFVQHQQQPRIERPAGRCGRSGPAPRGRRPAPTPRTAAGAGVARVRGTRRIISSDEGFAEVREHVQIRRRTQRHRHSRRLPHGPRPGHTHQLRQTQLRLEPQPHHRHRRRPDLVWTRRVRHNLVKIGALAA